MVYVRIRRNSATQAQLQLELGPVDARVFLLQIRFRFPLSRHTLKQGWI